MPPLKCMFIVEDLPITPNGKGGGSALFYSQLELIAHAGLDVSLVILTESRDSSQFRDFTLSQPAAWTKIKSLCVSHHYLLLRRESYSLRSLKSVVSTLRAPTNLLKALVNESNVTELQRLIEEERPALIWSTRRLPTVLALSTHTDTRIVYAHGDWTWRIKPLGRRWNGKLSINDRAKFWLWKRLDKHLVREVAGCVTASRSEADDMRQFGAQHVAYLPLTYADPNISTATVPDPPVRLVHLGGMQTTATRQGLERFLKIVWPEIRDKARAPVVLWVVGSLEGASTELLTLLDDVAIVCTGFVPELGTVLRPYDIHIVPWEHNTGTRTRIPLALSYAQTLVSTRAAAGAFPELVSEENCVLSDNLPDMASHIISLLDNDEERCRLGENGKNTFDRSFTRQAVQRKFDNFVQNVMGGARNEQRQLEVI